MNKRVVIVLSALIALMMVLLIWMQYREKLNYESRGALLISKIESYRAIHEHLPKDITELGEKEQMGEGPYFEKLDSFNYRVYFVIGFDKSKVYYSKLKVWQNER